MSRIRASGQGVAARALGVAFAAMLVSAGTFVVDAPPSAAAGHKWTVSASPDPGATSELRGVACASTTNCVAVGDLGDFPGRPLAESWNGSSWSITLAGAKGGVAGTLFSVSCPTITYCVAAGYQLVDHRLQTLLESWDGASWSVMPSPNRGTRSNQLANVSCATPTSCIAVGKTTGRTSAYQTLILEWDGVTWSVSNSADATTDDVLVGVSCWAANRCVATGSYGASGQRHPMVENWNGHHWTITPSEDPPTTDDYLSRVSCVSANWCVAVGFQEDFESDGPLIEVWDGATWSVSPFTPPGTHAVLAGITCVSSARCVAFGNSTIAGSVKNLVESWHGSSWSNIPAVGPPHMSGYGLDVSCATADVCFGVSAAIDNVAFTRPAILSGRA